MSRAQTALDAASAGAAVAEESYRTSIERETKASKMDFVTEADTGAQERVVEAIRSEYPDALVVGEEGDLPETVPEGEDCWIVDPIDGTTNFVHEIPLWTTSVAAVVEGDPVAAATVAPALDAVFRADETEVRRDDRPASVSEKTDVETFTVAPILRYGPDRDRAFGDLMATLIDAFGDLRRLGCAQVTLGLVAAGSLDAAVSAQPEPNPWDTVAGVHMVERAGGTVTDLDGDRWRPGCEGIVATNGKRHEAVLEVVRSEVRG